MLSYSAAAETDWRSWATRADSHWAAIDEGEIYLTGDPEDNDRVSHDATYGLLYLINKDRAAANFNHLLTALEHGRKIARMADRRYRGQLGWATARYSYSLTRNSSFAEYLPGGLTFVHSDNFDAPSASDPTLPTGWTRSQASPQTCYWSSGEGHSNGGVVQITDGLNWTSLEQFQPHLVPGQWYLVECLAKSDSSTSWPNMDVRANGTFLTATKIDTYDTSIGGWQKVSILFQAPTNGDIPLLRLVPGSYALGAKLQYDTLRISKSAFLLPRSWRQILGDPLSTTVFPPEPGSDFGIVQLRNTGHDWQTVGQELFNPLVLDHMRYEPGQTYRLWIEAKSKRAPAVATVYDATRSISIAQLVIPVNAEFTRSALTFVAPQEPGHQLILLLYPGNYHNSASSASFRRAQVNQYGCYTITDSQILLSLLDVAIQVRLRGVTDPEVLATISSWIALAETVFRGWDTDWYLKDDFGAYIMADDGANGYPRATAPLNWLTATGSVAVELFNLTGKRVYRERAQLLAKAARHSITSENGKWYWRYQKELWPDRSPAPTLLSPQHEDLSHANATVDFVLRAHRSGIEFSRGDVQALTKTMKEMIWDGSLHRPDFAYFVNGALRNTGTIPPLWSWIDLIEFDPTLAPVLSMAFSPYKGIDRSGPLHSFTGLWYDQGWRVDAKMRLSQEIRRIACLQESDFERGLLSPWARYDDIGMVTVRELDPENKCLSISADGSTRWKVAQQDIDDPKVDGPYLPGARYQVYYRFLTEGNLPLYVQLYDWTEGKVLAWQFVESSSWDARVFEFRAPSVSGNRISLRLMPGILGATSGRVNIDDLLVYQVP